MFPKFKKPYKNNEHGFHESYGNNHLIRSIRVQKSNLSDSLFCYQVEGILSDDEFFVGRIDHHGDF